MSIYSWYLWTRSSNQSCKFFPPSFLTCSQSSFSMKRRPSREVTQEIATNVRPCILMVATFWHMFRRRVFSYIDIRKTSKGLKRAFCPLKPLKLCFKAIKSLKIFKTRIFLKIIAFSTFFIIKQIKRNQAFWCFADAGVQSLWKQDYLRRIKCKENISFWHHKQTCRIVWL